MNDENEVDEARQKKLEEYKRRAAARESEDKLKTALRMALAEDAYQRLSNVAFANKEFYMIAAQQVMLLFRKVGRRLTDAELVYLLNAIKKQTRKETKITFMQK
ncbi:MAG: DNA-binding protein [Candidatus Micrarchaeota archaeon]